MTARLLTMLVGSLLGSTVTLLVVDRDPVPVEVEVTRIPFELHYADPVLGGYDRIERGWFCDIVLRDVAHGYCTRSDG